MPPLLSLSAASVALLNQIESFQLYAGRDDAARVMLQPLVDELRTCSDSDVVLLLAYNNFRGIDECSEGTLVTRIAATNPSFICRTLRNHGVKGEPFIMAIGNAVEFNETLRDLLFANIDGDILIEDTTESQIWDATIYPVMTTLYKLGREM